MASGVKVPNNLRIFIFFQCFRSHQEEPEAVMGGVLKADLKNWQYSQENTCGRVFLIKLQVFTKKRDFNTGVFL